MTAPELYEEALRRGLRLETRGNKLAVLPAKDCPSDFAALLSEHKCVLLPWLEGRVSGLSEDCLPWLHVARQVLAGEFEGANTSTIESVAIGLRGIDHSRCQEALKRLAQYKKI